MCIRDSLDAGGTDYEFLGDIDGDFVASVVGKELGEAVILVGAESAVLTAFVALEDADLGEPLGNGVKVVGIARACEGAGQLGGKGKLDLDGAAGADGGVELELEHLSLIHI